MANTPLVGSLASAAQWSAVFPTDVDAYDTYTPTWLQGATNITKTVAKAAYMKVGRRVDLEVSLTATGVGVANNRLTISLPFTAAAGSPLIGTFFYNDVGTALFNGITLVQSTTQVRFFSAVTPGTDFGLTGGGFAVAVGVGDSMQFQLTYEAAS